MTAAMNTATTTASAARSRRWPRVAMFYGTCGCVVYASNSMYWHLANSEEDSKTLPGNVTIQNYLAFYVLIVVVCVVHLAVVTSPSRQYVVWTSTAPAEKEEEGKKKNRNEGGDTRFL